MRRVRLPSFGRLLFVPRGASPEASMGGIIRSVLPFIALALSVGALPVAFPELTLFLPRLMAP